MTRTVIRTAGLLLLLLTVTACGGSSDTTPPPELGTLAYAETECRDTPDGFVDARRCASARVTVNR